MKNFNSNSILSKENNSEKVLKMEVTLTQLGNFCKNKKDIVFKILETNVICDFIKNNQHFLIDHYPNLLESFLFLCRQLTQINQEKNLFLNKEENTEVFFSEINHDSEEMKKFWNRQLYSKKNLRKIIQIFEGHNVARIHSNLFEIMDFSMNVVAFSNLRPELLNEDLSTVMNLLYNLSNHILLEPMWGQNIMNSQIESTEQVKQFLNKMFSWLYNSGWSGFVIEILSQIISVIPTESCKFFSTPKFYNSVYYHLKMAETDITRESVYFMLSNLALSFHNHKQLLEKIQILELALKDFSEGSLSLQTEIVIFFGNLSSKLCSETFEIYAKNSYILQTLVNAVTNLEDFEIRKLAIESISKMIFRFEGLLDDVEEKYVWKVIKVLLEPGFMYQIEDLRQDLYERMDSMILNNRESGLTKVIASEVIDMINKIQNVVGFFENQEDKRIIVEAKKIIS